MGREGTRERRVRNAQFLGFDHKVGRSFPFTYVLLKEGCCVVFPVSDNDSVFRVGTNF